MGTADHNDWHSAADQASATADFVKDNFRLGCLLLVLAAEIVWAVFA